jgi:putative inorganic carbon (HCO3(-)) transporter
VVNLFNRMINALAAIEFWAVALSVAASMLTARLALPSLLLAAFFWLARLLRALRRPSGEARRPGVTRRTPVDWAVLLLLLSMLVTLRISAFPALTGPQAMRLLQGVALLYAAVNWATSFTRLRLLAAAVILSGAGLALMAPFSVDWYTNKLAFIPDEIYRRFSLLVADSVHPNVMAGALVILLPVGLGLLWFGWRRLAWFARAWIGLAILAMLAVVFLTASRGAWMALLAAGLLIAVLRWRRGWLLLPVAALAGAALFMYIGPGRLVGLLASTDLVHGWDGRVEIWSRGIYMLQDFPFTGVGMGAFGPVADRLYPFFSVAPNTIPHAHNLFLQVGDDLGAPGLIAWLAMLGMVTWSAWGLYRRGRQVEDSWAAGLGAGLLGSQLALSVHGLFDAVIWGMVRPAPLVWLVWGLALAAWGQAEHARRSITPPLEPTPVQPTPLEPTLVE